MEKIRLNYGYFFSLFLSFCFTKIKKMKYWEGRYCLNNDPWNYGVDNKEALLCGMELYQNVFSHEL